MKIILVNTSSFSVINKELIHCMKKKGYYFHFNEYKRKLSKQELINRINKDVVAAIAGTESWDKEVLLNAENISVISRCGVATDNIDIEFTKKNGIKVLNTEDAPSQAVAELSLALILSSLRKIHDSCSKMKEGIWLKQNGSLLHGKTLGIIGFGRIGKILYNLLVPFEMKILIFDPCYYGPHKTNNFNDLISCSDVITLHVPLTSTTKNIISSSEFNIMKKNIVLINLSRGGVVNENDLFNFLEVNLEAYAALDVFETEPYTGKLQTLKNIILTPHIGSYAKESRDQMEKDALCSLFNALNLKNQSELVREI